MLNWCYVAIKKTIIPLDEAVLLHQLAVYQFLKLVQNSFVFYCSDTCCFLFIIHIHSVHSDLEFGGFILPEDLLQLACKSNIAGLGPVDQKFMLVQLEGLNCALCLQIETDHFIKVACVEDGQEALLFGPEASQEFAYVVVDQVVLKHSNCLRC